MTKSLKQYPQILQGAIFVLFLILFITAVLRGTILSRSEEHPVLTLDEGWLVTRNGERLEEDTLTGIDTGIVMYGEVFTLSRTLTEENVWPSACLWFRNIHTMATVELDGEEIYSSGAEQFAKGDMVGRLICNAVLPAGWEGKTLTVRLTASENEAFYGLGPFHFGTEQDLYVRFLDERSVPFYISVFLVVFGLIQLFWMPLLMRSGGAGNKLFFSALTTLTFGVYLLGYYNLFDLLFDTPGINTMLEYASLYLLPLVISGFLAAFLDGKMRLMYRLFFAFDGCYFLLMFALHFLNVIHITRFLTLFYVIYVLETIPFLVSVVKNIGIRRRGYYDRIEEVADRTLAAGFVLYMLSCYTDAILFMTVKFTGGQEASAGINFVTAGSLLFSIAISMHYFLLGVVNLRTEVTSEALRNQAYSDPLTGLANRGACDLLFENLGKSNRRYMIVSIDLDYLKKVNDTYGHAEGDRMLQEFAAVLKECFANCELVGRMGGDEFIVILCDADCDNLETYKKRFAEMLEEKNRTETKYRFSASLGVADNREGKAGGRAHEVYLLADRRMYEEKRMRHALKAMAGRTGGVA